MKHAWLTPQDFVDALLDVYFVQLKGVAMSETLVSPIECPHCSELMRPGLVKTALWYEDKLYVVEDVPAQVCDKCVEQFYDEETTDALRRLTEEGFPFAEAKGEILVPLYTLKGLMDRAMARANEDVE